MNNSCQRQLKKKIKKILYLFILLYIFRREDVKGIYFPLDKFFPVYSCHLLFLVMGLYFQPVNITAQTIFIQV